MNGDADFSAMNVAELLNLLERDSDDGAGYGEPETFVTAGLRENESVHADDFSIHVDERPTGISRIDGGVGLDVGHKRIRICLASRGADDAHAYGVGKTLRTTEGEDELTLKKLGIAGERKRDEFGGAIQFDYGEIEFRSGADDVCRDDRASRREQTAGGAVP